jgi:putative ABC transport system permease protein
MLADLRDAARQFRKAPGFTATALITLALGIGATTAIFTLVHQVMLKSLPVTKPAELWRIGDKDRCCNWGGFIQGDDGDFALFSWEAYRNFRERTPEFVDLAALQAGNANLGVRRMGSQAPVDTRNGEYVSKTPVFGPVLLPGRQAEAQPLLLLRIRHQPLYASLHSNQNSKQKTPPTPSKWSVA